MKARWRKAWRTERARMSHRIDELQAVQERNDLHWLAHRVWGDRRWARDETSVARHRIAYRERRPPVICQRKLRFPRLP